jgi:hypothetical protein
MSDKIYFVSFADNRVHNINDYEHQIVNETTAYIGKDCGEDGFRVDDEVNLWTITEIAKFFE